MNSKELRARVFTLDTKNILKLKAVAGLPGLLFILAEPVKFVEPYLTDEKEPPTGIEADRKASCRERV